MKKYNVELTKYEWSYLKSFLINKDIEYKISRVDENFMNIEILTTEELAEAVNDHMNKLYKF